MFAMQFLPFQLVVSYLFKIPLYPVLSDIHLDDMFLFAAYIELFYLCLLSFSMHDFYFV
jgi:hypothetical protein